MAWISTSRCVNSNLYLNQLLGKMGQENQFFSIFGNAWPHETTISHYPEGPPHLFKSQYFIADLAIMVDKKLAGM